MPFAPPTCCPCGGRRTNGKCDRCANKDTRASSKARGYGTAWDKAKEAYLRRHPFCVCCLAQGRYNSKRGRTGLRVDHIVPKSIAPERFWDEENWQTLCLTCDLTHKQPLEKRSSTAQQVADGWASILERLATEHRASAKSAAS